MLIGHSSCLPVLWIASLPNQWRPISLAAQSGSLDPEHDIGCCFFTCRAFFPLNGSPATHPRLASYPLPQYSGYALNASPVADTLFGGAIQCIIGIELNDKSYFFTCRAFFPLTGSPATYPTLASYPVPQYSGYLLNANPVADALFGGAIQCSRDMEAEVQLDTVPYATSGAFTVNVWFQVSTVMPWKDS